MQGGPYGVNVSCLMTGLLWTDQINDGKREPGGEFEQVRKKTIAPR
jgi:hypothetical protein